MSILFIALPIALILVSTAITAFWWAMRRGQSDDLDTPAVRILHDDEPPDPA